MAINQNNICVNTFTKGMNTDTSYDKLSQDQYIYGENIRISSSCSLDTLNDPNNKSGAACPIPEGFVETINKTEKIIDILSTASIENIGVVIVKYENDTWGVYRIIYDTTISYKKIFQSKRKVSHDGLFSTVLNKEINDIVKLYIADGSNPIYTMFISEEYDSYNRLILDENYLLTNFYFPSNKIKITKKIIGTLPVGMVQYTYRFYKKYGIKSKLAPLTHSLCVIDDYRNKEQGNAKGTISNIGFQLQISVESEISNIFDSVQIYRLHYSNDFQNANVSMIYDGKFYDTDVFIYNDVGNDAIEQLSIEQFAALDGLVIVPNSIQQNQGYMFAANITDNTILNIDVQDFDARSFSFNSNKQTICYNEQDNTYDRAPWKVENTYDNLDDLYQQLSKIPTEYSINKYSDVNQSLGINDNSCCMFDESGQYIGGTGKNVSWRMVSLPFAIFDSINTKISTFDYVKNKGGELVYENSNISSTQLFLQNGVYVPEKLTLNDQIGSSMLRSLRRDTTYRYGIVLYDDLGRKTDVKWIADIKTPNIKQLPPTTCTDVLVGGSDGVYNKIFNTDGFNMWFGDPFNHNYDSQFVSGSSYKNSEKIQIKKGQTIKFQVESSVFDMQVEFYYSAYQYNTTTGSFDMISERTYATLSGRGQSMSQAYSEIKKFIEADSILSKYVSSVKTSEEIYLLAGGQKIYPGQSFLAEQDIYDAYVHYKCSIDFSFATNDLEKITCSGSALPNIRATVAIYETSDEMNIDSVIARPLGIIFNVHDLPKNITGYQIVRCNRNEKNSKNLLQCVVARPVRQLLPGTDRKRFSPYYPFNILTSQPYIVGTSSRTELYGNLPAHIYEAWTDMSSSSDRNIYQLYSPEIAYKRNTTTSLLKNTDIKINFLSFCYSDTFQFGNSWQENDYIYFVRDCFSEQMSNKESLLYRYVYKYVIPFNMNDNPVIPINDISDVLNPDWYQGYGNVQINGGTISSATKQYKSFRSDVGDKAYINWHCTGMYDMKSCEGDSSLGQTDESAVALVNRQEGSSRNPLAKGFVGPGPACLIASVEDNATSVNNRFIIPKYGIGQPYIGAYICNIQHSATQYSGFRKEDKKLDSYYGFGNFVKVQSDNQQNIVFDGDTYIVMYEIIQLHKAYDFNSKDTLESAQTLFYVPLESSINVYFDYGNTYRNTTSFNIQQQPNEITGISVQERPMNQYNTIFSQTNITNDIYEIVDSECDTFHQRIFYSDLKTTGEHIDSWLHFLPLNYIDADARYGSITNLDTYKDVLYCWQENSFGKLSVNERSLITDNNNNTIQLGQGGVLQRIDYIDIKSGMRTNDHSSVITNNGLYWIDFNNKQIMGLIDSAKSISKQTNVQNLLNSKFCKGIPRISYDLQNDELLCKCLEDEKQLVINTKYVIASSVYTRNYIDIIEFNNTIFGITNNFEFVRYNNRSHADGFITYMPYVLKFVVNQIPYITKVFDNQELVLSQCCEDIDDFKQSNTFSFSTNSQEIKDKNIDMTNHEYNISYAIPRERDLDYGNRLRGKWMTAEINNKNPKFESSISCVLTKFRQSLS